MRPRRRLGAPCVAFVQKWLMEHDLKNDTFDFAGTPTLELCTANPPAELARTFGNN